VVSEQEREAKRADFETASARLYAAQAQVSLDQAKVQQYVALTRFKSVTAPFSGTITERKIDVGNLVTAGSTTATSPLYHISQSDPLRVFVDVPQSLAAELRRPNTAATVSTADDNGISVTGHITRVSDAINPQARTMRVEVDIPNSQRVWVPGMYTRVAFQLAARGGVEIPAAALVFRADGPQVARVDQNGHVEFVPVTIVRDNGSLVELTSALRPGDRLVLNISSQIESWAAVTVSGAAPPPPAPAAPAG
jgi:RND family efflux transporter MFP subunit